MNVIVYGHPPTYKTGLGKLTKLMMNSLKNLKHNVFCLTKHPLSGPNDGYKIIQETPENRAGLISSFAEKSDIDLIISIGDLWDMETPYAFVNKKAVPWVAYMGLEGSTFPKYAQINNKETLDCTKILGNVSGVWAFSSSTKTAMETTLDIDQDKSCDILSPAVDVDRIRQAPVFQFKNYLNVPDDHKLVGFVGDNLYRKGLDLFCDFVKHFCGENLIGYIHSPTNNPQIGFNLREMLRSMNLEKFVYLKEDLEKTFKGEFTDDIIYGMYKSFDLFYHPHRAEGFGLCALEALISGARVKITNFGGVLDFIPSGTAIGCDNELYIQAGGVGYMGIEPTVDSDLLRYESVSVVSHFNPPERLPFDPSGYRLEDFQKSLKILLKKEYKPVITRRIV